MVEVRLPLVLLVAVQQASRRIEFSDRVVFGPRSVFFQDVRDLLRVTNVLTSVCQRPLVAGELLALYAQASAATDAMCKELEERHQHD